MISGSTTTIILTVTDSVSVTGVNPPLIDADTPPALNIYDSHNNVVLNTTFIRDSVGTYHYYWTAPATLDTYTLEFIATIQGYPNVERTTIVVTYS